MEAKQRVTSDNTQKEIRTRQRSSTSCTECRRRKQKCNQAKNTACNNCARRYPQVPCIYDSFRTLSKYKESIIDLTIIETKLEDSQEETFGTLYPISELESPLEPELQYVFPHPQPQDSEFFPSLSNQAQPAGSHHISLNRGRINKDKYPDENTSDQDVVAAIRSGQYYPYPEHHKECGYRLAVDGYSVAMNPLGILPIEPAGRHGRLFHFFAQRLSPYISSIDGNNSPSKVTSQWLSFVIHSPIAIHAAILSAACFQAATRNLNVEKSVDAMSSKVRLIALINEHIGRHRNCISDESIAAVMSLASNEAIYSDQRSTMAHMRGLRDMIESRGGIDNVNFGLLRKMLLRTDYQIACTYECELFLETNVRAQPAPALASFPLELDNPILRSHIPFIDTITVQNNSIETARILDDARLLTISVLALLENDFPLSTRDKILAGIHSIHQRLISSPDANTFLPEDFLSRACRAAAIIYSSAIITKTPLSMACTPHMLQDLWVTMWRVPLPRWKQIPGIFLWILLVANPFARDKPEGRFFKALTPATIMAMGLIDGETVMATLKGFMAVQRWLGGNLRGVVLPTRGSATSRTPENGLPTWTMSEESIGTMSRAL
ncbi:hypothetical protein BKA65DRAFT_498137 [Rhexocercosporidium sp. MPI-PUGE-AT-0058]|nr:hypothetical protein BKA65DRAFT_498137 [Rhexocercosporidium sp. MPI-PUGE-AT-0058]